MCKVKYTMGECPERFPTPDTILSRSQKHQRQYQRRLAAADPKMQQYLKNIDALLDKALEVCHNNKDTAFEQDLMRARWVIGMD